MVASLSLQKFVVPRHDLKCQGHIALEGTKWKTL
jgi:hypothetical protein